MVWYTPEDEQFEDLLYEVMQGNSEVDAKIQVGGNTLTLSIDFDDNGTFSIDEIKEYTKV